MAFQDKNLICRDCQQSFVFTAGEQEFFQQKGYTNEPRRCPSCRQSKRNDSSAGERRPREMFPATCSQCGKQTEVPFQPRAGRPVYCADCFSKQGNRPSAR